MPGALPAYDAPPSTMTTCLLPPPTRCHLRDHSLTRSWSRCAHRCGRRRYRTNRSYWISGELTDEGLTAVEVIDYDFGVESDGASIAMSPISSTAACGCHPPLRRPCSSPNPSSITKSHRPSQITISGRHLPDSVPHRDAVVRTASSAGMRSGWSDRADREATVFVALPGQPAPTAAPGRHGLEGCSLTTSPPGRCG